MIDKIIKGNIYIMETLTTHFEITGLYEATIEVNDYLREGEPLLCISEDYSGEGLTSTFMHLTEEGVQQLIDALLTIQTNTIKNKREYKEFTTQDYKDILKGAEEAHKVQTISNTFTYCSPKTKNRPY